MEANPLDATDLYKVNTSGAFPLHFTMQNVGELAHKDSDCPGAACNQTMYAGPFNCTEYKAGSFTQELGTSDR